MKAIIRIMFGLSYLTIPIACFAITTEHDVTPKYVRSHPDEFSIKVTKGTDGLIEFEIKHDVPRPMYHVANLTIFHNGKLIARSTTPVFGKLRDNTFHFSTAPNHVNESTFELSDGALAGSGEDAVPVPGTRIHRFRLIDFVPKKLLEPIRK
jgi:hypothetical protein